MNKKQLKCLWFGLIAIVLLGLYPPWVSLSYLPKGNIKRAGQRLYRFIGDPPKVYYGSGSALEVYFAKKREPNKDKLREQGLYWESIGYRIDYPRLFIQWGIVSVLTSGLIYTFKDKPKDNE